MDKDLERYEYLLTVERPTKSERDERQKLESKLNEKLEKGEYCQEHHKIYGTRCAPEKKRPTLKEQELEQQIKQLQERSVFVKCNLPECFPEHKYIEKDSIFYCEKLTNIGEVNWD